MRAAVASGSMGAVVMPSYGAANLHNRGLGLGLLNVLTTGLLYIVSKDETLNSLKAFPARRSLCRSRMICPIWCCIALSPKTA